MGVGQAVQKQTCQRPGDNCSEEHKKNLLHFGKEESSRSLQGEKVFLQDGQPRHFLCVDPEKEAHEAVLVPHVVRKHLCSSLLVAYGAGGFLHVVMLALDRTMQPAPLPANTAEMWVWWLSCGTSMLLAVLGLVTVFNSIHLVTPLADGIYRLENSKANGKFLNYAQYTHSAADLKTVHFSGQTLHNGYKNDPLHIRDQASEGDHNHFRIKVVSGDVFTLQCVKWDHHFLGVECDASGVHAVKILHIEVEEDDAEEKLKYRWRLKQVGKKVFRPTFYLENLKASKSLEAEVDLKTKGSEIPNGALIKLGENKEYASSQWVFEAISTTAPGRFSLKKRPSWSFGYGYHKSFNSYGHNSFNSYGARHSESGGKSLYDSRGVGSLSNGFRRPSWRKPSWGKSGSWPSWNRNTFHGPTYDRRDSAIRNSTMRAAGMDSADCLDYLGKRQIAEDIGLSSIGLPKITPGGRPSQGRKVGFDLEDGLNHDRVEAICAKCQEQILQRPIQIQDGQPRCFTCLDRSKKFVQARHSACGQLLTDPSPTCGGCGKPINMDKEDAHFDVKDGQKKSSRLYHIHCLDSDARHELKKTHPQLGTQLAMHSGLHPPLALTNAPLPRINGPPGTPLALAYGKAYVLPPVGIDGYYDESSGLSLYHKDGMNPSYQDNQRRDLLMAQDRMAKQTFDNKTEAGLDSCPLPEPSEPPPKDRDHKHGHHKHHHTSSGHHSDSSGHTSSGHHKHHHSHNSSDSEGRQHKDRKDKKDKKEHKTKSEKKDEKRKDKKEKKEKDKKEKKHKDRKGASSASEQETENSQDDTYAIPMEAGCSQSVSAFDYRPGNSSGWRGSVRLSIRDE